ncbi:MAG: hypothetical protein WA156_01840 [Methylocystis silviterrae]
MLAENASALVGAAVISVAVFPMLAISLRSKSEEMRLDGIATSAVCRACDFPSAQLFRFINVIFPKAGKKL